MDLVKGKKGLIMGVANERSIAWGIAKKLSENGAELAFTYLGDALKKRVTPLAESVNSKFLLDCNVENKDDIKKTFEEIKKKLANDITNKKLNKFYEYLLKNFEFTGGKLIGAGGGGFFLMSTKTLKKTTDKLKKKKVNFIDLSFDPKGSRIIEN